MIAPPNKMVKTIHIVGQEQEQEQELPHTCHVSTYLLHKEGFERGLFHRDQVVLADYNRVLFRQLSVVALEQVQQRAAHTLHIH